MKKGFILINTLVFAAIAVTVTISLVNWGATTLKNTQTLSDREQAFQIAEAGVEYYRWHLAHNPTDYHDGTGGQPGPYIHDFKDAQGDIVGRFELTITPAGGGSTIVEVESKGVLASDPNIKRTIRAVLAKPSLAKFAVVANNDLRFGQGTEVFGPVHSNGGIRFEGLAHNLVTSAKATYDDPDDSVSTQRFGVYTTISPMDPNPPAEVPNRPDVFVAGRQFPVQNFDFLGLTLDLANIKSHAQSGGLYFPDSGEQGYHIVMKTNNTFELYKVTGLQKPQGGCSAPANQPGWGTWSVRTPEQARSFREFVGNYTVPANGLVFVEDHLWIHGQINGTRVTIAAAKFPDNPITRKNITINDDLLYTHYDSTDVIALIAQGDINVGLNSEDDLRVDAALIAQNGRVGRYYYSDKCGSSYKRDEITLYGMIATNQRYGFAYTDGTGYQNRNIIYDTNLLYNPPPFFPLTSSHYETIGWDEVQ